MGVSGSSRIYIYTRKSIADKQHDERWVMDKIYLYESQVCECNNVVDI